MNSTKNTQAYFFTIILTLGLCFLIYLNSNAKIAKKLTENGLSFIGISDIVTSQKQLFGHKEKALGVEVTKSKSPENKLVSKIPLTKKEKEEISKLIKDIELLSFQNEKDNMLASFFETLTESEKKRFRIWYYGDSQIEGDRITSEIRALFQEQFGGNGIGFVPVSNPATYTKLTLGEQSDWKKLNCFKDKKKGKYFDVSGLAFIPKDNSETKFNTLKINVSKSLKYQSLLFLMRCDSGSNLQWKKSSATDWNAPISIKKISDQSIYTLSNTPETGNIEIRVKGKNIVAYGFYLEGEPKGVQLDNFGIRGHSGDGLSNIPSTLLNERSKIDQTSLVIFHYGNNVVPYLKSDKGSKHWFERIFQGMLSKYKKNCPNVSLLVIGPGDMGYKSGDELHTYSSASILNEWMKELSLKNGVAYFDFYTLMQREGGILAWKEKGLASLDGHLTTSGQKKFAKIVTKELSTAYSAYQIGKDKKQ